jgi:hypothetical protein
VHVLHRPGAAGQRAPCRVRTAAEDYGLGSERGLATPSPDGQGREYLCALPKSIMPLDSVDTLRRSWETAHHLKMARHGVAPAWRQKLRGRGRLIRGRLAALPSGELLRLLVGALALRPCLLVGELTRGPSGQLGAQVPDLVL